MSASVFIQFAFYAAGLAAFLVVGRNNLKKQTIEDQAKLIGALREQNGHQADQIDSLRHQNDEQEKRIKFLEEMIGDGYSRLVSERSDDHPRRLGRRNGPASSGSQDNREV